MSNKKGKKYKQEMRAEFCKLWLKKAVHKNEKKYSRKKRSNSYVETKYGIVRLL